VLALACCFDFDKYFLFAVVIVVDLSFPSWLLCSPVLLALLFFLFLYMASRRIAFAVLFRCRLLGLAFISINSALLLSDPH
jgi:hypothetical protein